MKLTENAETSFISKASKRKEVVIKFQRIGKKGAERTKELFRIEVNTKNIKTCLLNVTLEDLKRIVKDAETLIRFVDGEDITNV